MGGKITRSSATRCPAPALAAWQFCIGSISTGQRFGSAYAEGMPLALETARQLLCALEEKILDALIAQRQRDPEADLTAVAEVTVADTIYAVDKISEAAILAWFAETWPAAHPVQVVMEGLENHGDVTFPVGTPVEQTAWKCLIDPIDGTRMIMYDKRSAWALAALAPQRGQANTLADIVVAAMTELPTSRMASAVQLSAVRGGGVHSVSLRLPEAGATQAWEAASTQRRPYALRPYGGTDLLHGFGSLAKFVPGAKTAVCQLEEDLLRALQGSIDGLPVFDDQYISTGGQIFELCTGHDRWIGDLRPIFHARLGLEQTLVCHPYDICTALIAQELGAVVEQPNGSPLDAPLDTTTPVSWMAYANPRLAQKMRPVLQRLLA